ncbi:MAG TPA: transcriptional regulator [Treponema sp.]|jgi:TrpR family trp operon transcriptional repressor|nr:transcriptional regulator [Treponema sp.]
MRTKNTESLENEQNNDAIEEICGLLADIQDKQLIYGFFECLFTKAELKDFSNRWHLVKELDAGTTQREIARKYGMSLCNITRGSREMKKENSAFRHVLDILKQKKATREE